MAPHLAVVTAVHRLTKRNNAYKQLASAGAKPPTDLAGPGFQVLFAFIGVGMTLMAIWFFFWAKNGGFKWRKDDWEDYKSTVMRRKGPDGKTLSNATKSTILGGGSVVHGGSYGAPSSVGYTDETGTSVDVDDYRDAEEGKGRGAGMRGGDGNHGRKKKRRDHTNDYNDPELRNYRSEKPARVGGLNRQADGMYTDYSGSQPSEIGSNTSGQPLVKKEPQDPKKEAKAKEMRARERMKKAKAAEKVAARVAAFEAKAQKAEAKREKDAAKKAKKAKSVVSEAPEMAEVTRPLTEYTRTYTEYTAPSEAPAPAPVSGQKLITGPRRAPPSAAYSFTTGDDNTTVVSSAYTDPQAQAPTEVAESSYYSDYRPKAELPRYSDPNKHIPRSSSKSRTRPSGARPSSETRRSSSRQRTTTHPSSRPSGSRPPSKSRSRPSRSAYSAAPSDIFTATNGDAHGHMSYPCHIPGLSQYAESVGVSESVSQVGGRRGRGRGRDVMDGYRRGGAGKGRRDSLSDSD